MQLTTTTLLTALAVLPSLITATPTSTLPAGYTSAQPFRRSLHHLNARTLDVDPEEVCGVDYEECPISGWCCSSGTPCAGDIDGIPVCKDPSFTLGPLKGTAVATPFADLEGVLNSLAAKATSMYDEEMGVYTAVMNTVEPEETGVAAMTSVVVEEEEGPVFTTLSTTGRTAAAASTTMASENESAAASAAASSIETEGAGVAVRPMGFGGSVVRTVMVWGVAALGGAGWMLLG